MDNVELVNSSFQMIWADMLRGTVQKILEEDGKDSSHVRLALIIQFMFADSQLPSYNIDKGMIVLPTLAEKGDKIFKQRITPDVLRRMRNTEDQGGFDMGLLIYAVGEKQRNAGLTPFLISEDSGLKGIAKRRGLLG